MRFITSVYFRKTCLLGYVCLKHRLYKNMQIRDGNLEKSESRVNLYLIYYVRKIDRDSFREC